MFDSLIRAFNALPIWRREVQWGRYAIQVPNFDRWLYVKLQGLRLMGERDREFLLRHVRRGMTVVDVGANIGLYSLFLAEQVGDHGKVFAFEPDPVLFEAAVTNSRRNGKNGVITAENLALGSRRGEAKLYRSAYNSGDNRLSASHTHGETVPVQVARGDDVLGGAKIDLIKMDVQGWEAEVLRGMVETLRSNPGLIVFFEYWPEGLHKAGEKPLAPIEILRRCGFTLFRPDREEPLSGLETEKLANTHSGQHFVNLMAKRI